MTEINFQFKETFISIQCNTEDKIIDILTKFALKVEEDIDDLYFLYDGSKVDLSNEKLTVGELANNLDKSRKIMSMIVNKTNTTIIKKSNHNKKLNEIICPDCFGNARIKIEDYKIKIFECGNKHIRRDIFFKDFENTQYIDESKILCSQCKIINKAVTHQNKFYKCNSCKSNLCPLCKNSHNNEHYIVDYDKKNYYCNIHDELYNYYCKTCHKNFCIECEKSHKEQNHKFLSFSDLFPEQDKKKKELEDFNKLIVDLKKEIEEIKSICDNYFRNIEIYREIYSNIINNYNNNKNRNYQILANIKDIKDKNIIDDINEIIKEKNKDLKFKKIYEIYNKMNIKNSKNETESKITFKKINNNDTKKKSKAKNRNRNIKKNINIKIDNKDDIVDKFYKTNNGFYHENFDISNESKKKLNNNKNNKKYIDTNNKYNKRRIDKTIDKKKDETKNKTTRNSSKKNEKKNKISNQKNIKRIDEDTLKKAKSVLKFKTIKEINEISIKYKIDKNDKFNEEVQIFGFEFVFNNAKKCHINYNKKYDLSKNFNIKDIKENTFEIKLVNISNITNMSYMFSECTSLLSVSDLSKWDTSNITDMSYVFYGCSSLTKLSGISEWDTKNVIYMNNLFSFCKNLENLPDISKWNTNKVKDLNNIFSGCSSLKELPDISKWNTSHVMDIKGIFNNCTSLKKLPDISKWNTENATSMSNLFKGCKSLSSLPDISKWHTNNVITMTNLFSGCSSLKEIPDISKWNTKKVKDMSNMFNECNSLSSLPKISN